MKKHLAHETNTLISTSTTDRQIQLLATEMNIHLRELREKRRRYENGDQELKVAATNISHDLRTPLTAISGYLELLEQEEKSVAATQYLNTIKNRTDAMKELIEQLFHYSMITSSTEKPNLTVVSLNAVLEESISTYYSALVEKNIEPTITIPDEPINRFVDQQMLHRIFDNLLSNAIKYSDGDLHITLSPNGTISFMNTASSLTTIEVEKLFNRFYTVESARHSTGLGLSIVKSLVEQLNGQISTIFHNNQLTIALSFPKNNKSK
ncbi:sensor histidine kinase [Metalysinibacillus jejuensis]|uniref:sensor histidine kinase n=1 Tax=Metalysinibacillus jejuensis TaxID=914327 RepID=UPI001912E88C|nr:HAMP domain-containing sensor histidine kinase [Metalysinibacillus jejuensis]